MRSAAISYAEPSRIDRSPGDIGLAKQGPCPCFPSFCKKFSGNDERNSQYASESYARRLPWISTLTWFGAQMAISPARLNHP